MTDLLFPDISEFQDSANIRGIRSQTGAIADRILYGTTPDKEDAKGRVQMIRSCNFDCVVWYIFMRNLPAQDQLNAMKTIIPQLQPGEVMCVDWEADTNHVTPPASLRDQLLTLMDQFYGQSTLLYGPASSLAGYNGSRCLWVAGYGEPEPTQRHTIWQYTDGRYKSGGHSPINWNGAGFCDTSVFHGTAAQMAQVLGASSRNNVITLGPIEVDMQVTKQMITVHLGPDGRGYSDVVTPFAQVIGAPSINASNPGPPDNIYPPTGIELSALAIGQNVTRVVAVGGSPNAAIGVWLSLAQ